MKLFGKKEKNMNADEQKENLKTKDSGIKILGSGCAKCEALEQNVREAVKELKIDKEISHVRDFAEIASYGVMSTPAIVMDGKVLCAGRVLTKSEVKELLK
ncbi:MAG: thioredoxin family protein [Tissierellia bacterium]|nr:thioredoxin family protein [Tissierellia bacterium]